MKVLTASNVTNRVNRRNIRATSLFERRLDETCLNFIADDVAMKAPRRCRHGPSHRRKNKFNLQNNIKLSPAVIPDNSGFSLKSRKPKRKQREEPGADDGKKANVFPGANPNPNFIFKLNPISSESVQRR